MLRLLRDKSTFICRIRVSRLAYYSLIDSRQGVFVFRLRTSLVPLPLAFNSILSSFCFTAESLNTLWTECVCVVPVRNGGV